MPRARKQPITVAGTTDAMAADATTTDASAPADGGSPAGDTAPATEAAAIDDAQTRAAEDAETRAAEDQFVAGAPAISEPEPGQVRMTQASAASIRATTVDAQQSAVGRMSGSSITMRQGATGLVRGTDVRLEQGAVAAIAADHVELRDGFAFLVVARRISGNVTVLLDWRALLMLMGVLLVLGRLLRGRR